MCGIALALLLPACSDGIKAELWKSLVASVASRGPDAQDHLELQTTASPLSTASSSSSASEAPQSATLKALGATLWMRGDLTPQPITCKDDPSNFLLFNGEIFGGFPQLEVTELNDGTYLFARLQAASEDGIKDVLAQIQGPFALVYVRGKKVFYARDRIGRRSLLHHLVSHIALVLGCCQASDHRLLSKPTEERPFFFLSSVWPSACLPVSSTNAEEVEPATLHTLALDSLHHPPRTELIWSPYSANPTIFGDFETKALKAFQGVLLKAVQRRAMDLRRVPHDDQKRASRVAVLFSGGLDCATLALLTSQALPAHEPIDLINVAFENPRTALNNKDTDDIYEVPDRLTARAAYGELARLHPERQWNLVFVNVTAHDALASQNEVLDLMEPQQTEMDLSIAIALNKAVKGTGVDAFTRQPVQSTARILLSGLGADELFGGYSRHRRAFGWAKAKGEEAQWHRLREELDMDLKRIGTRNLGRDDRCTALHGKEVRYPFLDENVIEFVAALPVSAKCDPRLPEGEGDKRFLRQVASALGLEAPSTFKKRALQFGSRSAKRQLGVAVSGTDPVPRTTSSTSA